MMPARGGQVKLGRCPDATVKYSFEERSCKAGNGQVRTVLYRSRKLTSSLRISEHDRFFFVIFLHLFLDIGIYIPLWDKFS